MLDKGTPTGLTAIFQSRTSPDQWKPPFERSRQLGFAPFDSSATAMAIVSSKDSKWSNGDERMTC